MKRISLWLVLIVLMIVAVLPVNAGGLVLHEQKCVQRAGVATMYLYKAQTGNIKLATLVNGNPIYAPEVSAGLRVWVLAKTGVNTWREGYIDPLQCQLFDPDVPTISGAKLFQAPTTDEPLPVEPTPTPAEPLTTAFIVVAGINVLLIIVIVGGVWIVMEKLADGTSSSGMSVILEVVVNVAEKLARALAAKTPNFTLDDDLADALSKMIAERRSKPTNITE